MNKSDAELIKACQKNNDLKAFETLVKRHQDKVRAVVYKFINNSNELDDISQEVFIKAFKSIKSYRSEAKFSTWLYRIATNETLTFLSQQRMQNITSSLDLEETLLSKLESDTYFSGDETQKKLQKAILTLPEKQRLVFQKVLVEIQIILYHSIQFFESFGNFR